MELNIRNVIFVSYDSVRADVAYGGLPAVERLRRRGGATFSNCIASAPFTPVSHASVMTGLQPYNHGIRHLLKETLDPSCLTLASILRNAGFETSAIVSCPGLNGWYQISRGFEHYDDEIPRLPDGSDPLQTVDVKLRGQALKRAPLVTERSRKHLSSIGDQRFFHFIHFFDAHWPYEAPEKIEGVGVRNPYEGEVAYLDHYFDQWLDWMEEQGHLEDSLVVLFGDHGEDLNGWYENDKGGDDKGHPEENGHGCLLYESTIKVPLILSHPGLPSLQIDQQARLVDIVPTVLALLQLPAERVDGISLAPAILGNGEVPELPAYSETFYPREQTEATGGDFEWTRNKKSVRLANRYKVVFHLDSDVVEVYDLKADPNEESDLLAQRA